MKVNSKKPTRFLGIFVLSMIVAMSFSCKKEKVEPANNTNPAGGTTTAALVAKANLNFVDDLEVLDFECHKRKNYQEVELHGDSVMYLKFNSVNNLGKKVEGPLLLINMKSHNGFFTANNFNLRLINLTLS